MTTVRDLGEKTFIRKLLSQYAVTARIDALDDCIVIDPESLGGRSDAPLLVYSMDHPSPIDRPIPPGQQWRYFGRWAAAVTSNDVLAMGARPRGFSLDLAISADTGVDAVGDFYDGLAEVVAEYGATIEGGNVDINPNTGVVGMCWGTVPREGIIRRRGARPGDQIAVTTELGLGWASYVLRRRGRFEELDPTTRSWLESYNLMPLAPHRAIVRASHELPGAITSGMDLSDGLLEFLYTIGEANGFGAVVDERLLPAPPVLRECARLLGVPATMLAFEFGFDMPRSHGYTVDPSRWDAVAEVFEREGTPLFRIGEVAADPQVTLRCESGAVWDLPAFWDDKCHRDGAIERWVGLVEEYPG